MSASNSHKDGVQVSSQRVARLYRLLRAIAERPRSRPYLIRLGRAGMRTFYRDLEFLLASDIEVRLSHGKYELVTSLDEALTRLAFPAADLTFADVLELSRGRGEAQIKLRKQLNKLVYPGLFMAQLKPEAQAK